MATIGLATVEDGKVVDRDHNPLATEDAVALKANTSDLSDVATSGEYSDLTGAPTTLPPTDGSVTNAKVAVGAGINADKIADGTANKVYTATEKTKLAGIATAATANQTDADLLNRANHTGSQAQSTITNLISDLSAKADLVGGVIPTAQIPAIALTEFLGVVDDESEMVALTGQPGDFCYRTDTESHWILVGDDPTDADDWISLGGAGGGAVDSVNGQIGIVVLSKSDVGLNLVDNTSDIGKPISTATQTALDAKAANSAVVHISGNETVAGIKTFSSSPVVPDGAFTIAKVSTLQTALDSKPNTANVVGITGNQSISGNKTFNSAPIVPDASFAIAKVTGLQTALDAKAADSAVVKVTGAQTIAGIKTFSSAPVVPSGSFSIASVTDLQSTLDGKAADNNVVKLSGSQVISGEKTFALAPIVPDESFDFDAIAGLQDALDYKISSIVEGSGVDVDISDVLNPVISLSAGSIASLSKADTALQSDDIDGYVPVTRSVNGQTLASDVVISNVASADKLSTARDINGVSFDGTSNITIVDSTKVPTTRQIAGQALSADVSAATLTAALSGATDTAKGTVELATTAEATTGTDTTRAVTPAGLKTVADTKVPTTRTVAGQALSGNISASALATALGPLTLANSAPGTTFDVNYDGDNWSYNGATVIARPSARTDLVMQCINPVDDTVPAWAIAGDRLFQVS